MIDMNGITLTVKGKLQFILEGGASSAELTKEDIEILLNLCIAAGRMSRMRPTNNSVSAQVVLAVLIRAVRSVEEVSE